MQRLPVVETEVNRQRVSSLRIFEGRFPGGNRCFLKEYLSEGQTFGKRELSVSRKLSSRWNEIILSLKNGSLPASSIPSDLQDPPFAMLIGYMRPDENIESDAFRVLWARRFPTARPPQQGNLWLVFRWDDASFKNFKRFPPLPQIGAISSPYLSRRLIGTKMLSGGA